MRLFKMFYCLLTFLLFCLPVQADNSAIDELNRLLSSWKSLSANFVQRVVDHNDKLFQKYSGSLYVEKPNRFRWVITTPEPQLIIADGKNLWIYDEELEQATVQPLTEQLSETPALFLSGSFTQIEQGFTINTLKTKDQEQQFVLLPKKEDTLIEHIVLVFNAEDRLMQMQVRDVLGQTTKIYFTKLVANPKLSDDLFIFVPPKNVDIIGEQSKS